MKIRNIKNKGKGCHKRILKCAKCEKKFISNSKPAINYFCSSKCYHAFKHGDKNPNYKGGDLKFICQNCTEIFYLSRMRSHTQAGKFCSVECYMEDKKKNKMSEYEAQIHKNMKRAIAHSLHGKKNNIGWQKLVGYSRKDLIAHLESKFTKGMNWKNYGEWHIDHIIPKSFFKFSSTDDSQFLKCWALSNLQPLWALENIIKGNRVKNPFL